MVNVFAVKKNVTNRNRSETLFVDVYCKGCLQRDGGSVPPAVCPPGQGGHVPRRRGPNPRPHRVHTKGVLLYTSSCTIAMSIFLCKFSMKVVNFL